MITYVTEDDLDTIFSYIEMRYTRIEEVPRYREEYRFDEFCGVLRQAAADTYYPSIQDKATYLLIGIIQGHFFSNGNKRLALVVMAFFLSFNGFQLREKSKAEYQELLGTLFPEHGHWEDYPDFSPRDYATYNLAVIIAQRGEYHIAHEDLKRRVGSLLESVLEPKPSDWT